MLISVRKKGFTLVEILCVLAIISIIAGIHNLNLNAFTASLKLKLATRELIHDLRFAKMYAASNYSATTKLQFYGEVAGDTFTSYKIYVQNRNVGTTLKEVKLKKNIVVDCAHSTFGVSYGAKSIEFRYNGSVKPACTIALKDTVNNKLRYITLTIGYTRAMEVDK
jgi:prepilin-type N-terminal cleavage/methylation domain-containing protein